MLQFVVLRFLDVLIAVGLYVLASRMICREYKAQLKCPNPLHRAEAGLRAAIEQTAMVRDLLAIGAVIAVRSVVLPADWPWWVRFAVTVGAIIPLLTINHRWKLRRARELDLTGGPCR